MASPSASLTPQAGQSSIRREERVERKYHPYTSNTLKKRDKQKDLDTSANDPAVSQTDHAPAVQDVHKSYTIPWEDLRAITPDKHHKRDESHEGQQCSGCICFRDYISKALSYWVQLPKWTPATKQHAEKIFQHLVEILQVEAVDSAADRNVKVLTETLPNPNQFCTLVWYMLCATGELFFEKIKISDCITKDYMKRLGTTIKEIHGVDDIVSCVNDPEFRSLHGCTVVDNETVSALRKQLGSDVSSSWAEIGASANVNLYFRALFNNENVMTGALIDELPLHRTIQTVNDPNDMICLSGNMDFIVVSLKRMQGNLFTNEMPEWLVARGATSKKILRHFKCWSRSYSRIDARMEGVLQKLQDVDVSHEITLVEVKKASKSFAESPPCSQVIDPEEGYDEAPVRNMISQSSSIHQILSTCHCLGSYGFGRERVMKFISTDACCWRFGILDNDTGITSYTEVFDNTSRNDTELILNLLILWLTLPGTFLRDYLFARCRPVKIIQF